MDVDKQDERTMRGRKVTVEHSKKYLCRHESTDGVRTHHAHAERRYRVGLDSKRWPLCAGHAEQWRQQGLIAGRPGPRESSRRALADTAWSGWDD